MIIINLNIGGNKETIAVNNNLRDKLLMMLDQLGDFIDDNNNTVIDVTAKAGGRSIDQNKKMWAMLSDVASQVQWHGVFLSAEEWKHIFSASLWGQRRVPSIDGNHFVVMGQSTSKMTKKQMADMITLIEAFGYERGVIFSDLGEVAQ